MLKLNNKGFAIASILYSIMVLFLILLLSILGMLGTRKATLDKNKKDIIRELNLAFITNKIVFEHRDITILNNCDRDAILDALMDGVSAIGSTEDEIIGSEYIRYEGIDVDNIQDTAYKLVYTANNGGNTIVGTRNVYFGEAANFDTVGVNGSTLISCTVPIPPASEITYGNTNVQADIESLYNQINDL